MTNRNLNGSTLTFTQDGLIKFNEAEHKYSVDGIGQLTSVSNIVGMFFKEFDAEYWSLRKCGGNPIEAAKMKDEWTAKGQRASQTGTFLHKQIEDFFNGCFDGQLICTVEYNGEYVKIKERVDISKEWSYFQNFKNNTLFTPFRTEWRVYDTDAKIAGTIDFVCACSDGTYEIYDWKRSNKIDPKEHNRFQSGLNGLQHLTDTTYIHYCLQQNLYRYILEKNYGITIKRMNLVVLHPELNNYQIVPINRMDNEVHTIIRHITR
jgi:hypothetical protein